MWLWRLTFRRGRRARRQRVGARQFSAVTSPLGDGYGGGQGRETMLKRVSAAAVSGGFAEFGGAANVGGALLAEGAAAGISKTQADAGAMRQAQARESCSPVKAGSRLARSQLGESRRRKRLLGRRVKPRRGRVARR